MNLKVKVISFGKASGETFSDEIARLYKMCRPWATVDIVCLKSADTGNGSVDVVLFKEAQLIKNCIPKGARVVALGEEGKLMTSYSFADYLQKVSIESKELVFVIGSAYGLSNELKQGADFILSLSPLTFPYKLCKLVFAEQLYRGLSICNNHPYHKE